MTRGMKLIDHETRAFGYKQFFVTRWVRLSWLGSWDRPSYSRFGMWRGWRNGITLRYRGYLLAIGRE